MDGTLKAKELGERFDDMFAEVADISKFVRGSNEGWVLRKPAALSY